jgi:mannitol/fructose-specific phosphotransferase system IIA component (Ntr-type)
MVSAVWRDKDSWIGGATGCWRRSQAAATKHEDCWGDKICGLGLKWDGEWGEMGGDFMNLGDILTGPRNILPDMQAADRWLAIDDLVGNLIVTGRIKVEDRDAITAVVKKRESSMSTGIGFGIGIPHASTELIPEVVGALGRSGKGINFDALDNQPVNLVMLFLVPQGQFQKHLHTLAGIAKLLHIKEFRQELEQAADAEAMWVVIRKYSAAR